MMFFAHAEDAGVYVLAFAVVGVLVWLFSSRRCIR